MFNICVIIVKLYECSDAGRKMYSSLKVNFKFYDKHIGLVFSNEAELNREVCVTFVWTVTNQKQWTRILDFTVSYNL